MSWAAFVTFCSRVGLADFSYAEAAAMLPMLEICEQSRWWFVDCANLVRGVSLCLYPGFVCFLPLYLVGLWEIVQGVTQRLFVLIVLPVSWGRRVWLPVVSAACGAMLPCTW